MLALAFLTAVIVASSVFYAGWDLLGVQGIRTERRLDSKTLFDLVKLSFGVVAGAGALVALIVAYRRQRVDEDGAVRDATRLHNERFTTAVSQLGEVSPAVRLGGVHALAGLADDAPTRALRQTCIDVLCAYLRLPYVPQGQLPDGDTTARHEYLALREVRHTIVRLIRDHLRLDTGHPHSWQGHDLDFTSAVFDGKHLSFAGAVFSGGNISFAGATFATGGIDFGDCSFRGANVSFEGCAFSTSPVNFAGATFSGGFISFEEASFASSSVNFGGTRFSGGSVSFQGATFSGCAVGFVSSTFSSGRIDFEEASFTDGQLHFGHARFEGTRIDLLAHFSDCTVTFDNATFTNGNDLSQVIGSTSTT
ncbi:pentapeptide repeat-containing protein [Streptomyces sp. MBT42]|uniref:pentapeptide repeat-containing protein n=1 Tax=Streptomyces sp. MBT42 TaxID=1488373 RepID=UPI001E4EFB94|nr:pentapeptide repeat-containing protein [Streptomyces sp. MBT42]MCD2468602.1 pentapeptide repeat-containing protein [Streptomyces sp. MBT42]